MEQSALPGRNGAVDWVKSLAVCSVLFIHSATDHYALHPVGSLPWLAADFYGGVSRWAVPAFLMCSGALMNAPERLLPLKKLFSRYLLRLLAALAVWSVLYELLCIAAAWGGDKTPAELLLQSGRNLLYGKTFYHLYYFYYAFSLYLALPLTRLVVRWGSGAELRYLLILWFLFGAVLPFFQYFPPLSGMSGSLLLFVLPSAFLCPGLGLLGWFFCRYPPAGRWGALGLFAAGFAVTFLGTWHRSVQSGGMDYFYLMGFSLPVLAMAAGVFRLCQLAAVRWPQMPRAVVLLSRASFCIYLIHPFFQAVAAPAFFRAMPPLWGIPLQAGMLLVLSTAAYLVLRRIPVVNRWLI